MRSQLSNILPVWWNCPCLGWCREKEGFGVEIKTFGANVKVKLINFMRDRDKYTVVHFYATALQELSALAVDFFVEMAVVEDFL